MVTGARAALLQRFAWVEGHADVWRVLSDGAALAAVVEGLAAPWTAAHVTHVVGVEARGFLLGGAVAVQLGAGFVGVRKAGTGLLPGPKVTVTASPDYRGTPHVLRMQRAFPSGARVLLVDDWAERGSQALAARDLVEQAGATFLGASLLVDQLDPAARASIGRVTALVTADELGPPPGGAPAVVAGPVACAGGRRGPCCP